MLITSYFNENHKYSVRYRQGHSHNLAGLWFEMLKMERINVYAVLLTIKITHGLCHFPTGIFTSRHISHNFRMNSLQLHLHACCLRGLMLRLHIHVPLYKSPAYWMFLSLGQSCMHETTAVSLNTCTVDGGILC